jgi:hypothetical protein
MDTPPSTPPEPELRAAIEASVSTVAADVDQPSPWLRGVAYLEGTTESPGQAPGICCELVVGPVGADPTSDFASWCAFPMEYDGEREGADLYRGSACMSQEGEYDWAVRFSLDGAQWTYGDRDGSANGYSPSQSGKLQVTGGPLLTGAQPAAIPVTGACGLTVLGRRLSAGMTVQTRRTGAADAWVPLDFSFLDAEHVELQFPDPAPDTRDPAAYDLRVAAGASQPAILENAFLAGYVRTPTLDGAIETGAGDWQAAHRLATDDRTTDWPGQELRELWIAFDAGGLYLGLVLKLSPQSQKALVIYLDTDFGSSTGFSVMSAIGDEDAGVPQDWLRLDRAVTSPLDACGLGGFGADFAFGSFEVVPSQSDYLDALTGWRTLEPGELSWHALQDPQGMSGPCLAGLQGSDGQPDVIETFVPWTVLFGSASPPAGGRTLALFARIVDRNGQEICNQSLPAEPEDANPWNVTRVVTFEVR